MIWSGGADEYVMAKREGLAGSSGFSTLPESKYYDIYKISSNGNDEGQNYNINSDKKGDAMYETSTEGLSYTSWFQDSSKFAAWTNFWFKRGGTCNYTNRAGLFCFNSRAGENLR